MQNSKTQLLCVVGPTAAGKSELAVQIAQLHPGEIISADSRQIYKGLNIGTGKVEGQWVNQQFIYKNIPHHLIDELDPAEQFSAANFKQQADAIIEHLLQAQRLPIVCGGTMHWIDALVYNLNFPAVEPQTELRKELESLPTDELFQNLTAVDPKRAQTIDRHNRRRLIRAIEIAKTTGRPVEQIKPQPKHQTKWIGIYPGMEQLEKNIKARVEQRLNQGAITEVETLHKQGLSWQRLESFGLMYKYITQYLTGKIAKQEMIQKSYIGERQYAKRQLTWWKRNPEIEWNQTAEQALKNLAL